MNGAASAPGAQGGHWHNRLWFDLKPERNETRTADALVPSNPAAPKRISSLALDGMAIPQNVGKITHLLFTPPNTGACALKDEYLGVMETLIRSMPDTRFTIVVSTSYGKQTTERLLDKIDADGALGDRNRVRIADLRNAARVYPVPDPDNPGKQRSALVAVDPDNLRGFLNNLRGWASACGGKLQVGFMKDSRLFDAVTKELDRDPALARKVSLKKQNSSAAALTMWAQDSLLVIGNKLVVPERGSFHKVDREVPRYLAALYPEFHTADTPFQLEGGNVLPTPSTVYLGSKYLLESIPSPKRSSSVTHGRARGGISATKDEIAQALSSVFPKQKSVVLQDQPDDCFHIDMGLTWIGPNPATGKPRVVVADVKQAKEILYKLKTDDPARFTQLEHKLSKEISDRSDGKPLTLLLRANTREMEVWADREAGKLEKAGYEVLRIPFLATDHSASDLPWITYNNALVHDDKIFMPSYGIRELDDCAAQVYTKAGYNVVPIYMPAISSLQGALNCITKGLERSYDPAELIGAA